MKVFLNCLLLLGSSILACGQSSLLHSGPMPGFSGITSVTIWMQTKEKAVSKIAYKLKDSQGAYQWSTELASEERDGNTYHFELNNLKPGSIYQYEIYINNNKETLSAPLFFKTQPDSICQPEFSFAVGSCAYTKDPASGDPSSTGYYQIYKSIAALKPEFMLWLGDNIYFENADLHTREGMMYRYTFSRGNADLQPLLRNTHHYAIWDDHDFGPNDSDSTFKNKKYSHELFKLFWTDSKKYFNEDKSIASTYSWYDLDFFLLDDRSFRAPAGASRRNNQLLGKEQIDWLISGLKKSKATFKFVAMGGQILNPARVFENYSRYKREWKYLLTELQSSGVSGIIMLTGDRHFSELTKAPLKNHYPFYELTSSPLTSSVPERALEKNKYRVPGSLVRQRNFGFVSISGAGDQRYVLLQLLSTEGSLLWEKKIYKTDIH